MVPRRIVDTSPLILLSEIGLLISFALVTCQDRSPGRPRRGFPSWSGGSVASPGSFRWLASGRTRSADPTPT